MKRRFRIRIDPFKPFRELATAMADMKTEGMIRPEYTVATTRDLYGEWMRGDSRAGDELSLRAFGGNAEAQALILKREQTPVAMKP